MYKSHKVQNEITVFIKRHIVICLLLFASLLAVAKYSRIPVPNWLPVAFEKMFLCPAQETSAYEWWGLINNLSLAYIASIITYVVIQYIPERRKAYKAFNIAKKDLSSLFQYMSRLISMYLFTIGIKPTNESIKLEDLKAVCNIDILDKENYCKIIGMRDGQDGNTRAYSYNLFKDSKQYVDFLNKKIDKIKSSMYSGYLDPDIVELISRIENNWFIQYLSSLDKPMMRTPGYRSNIIDFDKAFFSLIKCHSALGRYDYTLMTYAFSEISDQELQEENENRLFLAPRVIYEYKGETIAIDIANGITALPSTEERLKRSEGVLLEMLVYYDSTSPKPLIVLESALRIAEYIRKNQSDILGKQISIINCLQIKKRLNTITTDDYTELKNQTLFVKSLQGHQLITKSIDNGRNNLDQLSSKELKNYILVGAYILLEDYEKAAESFSKLNDDQKDLYIQFPIYHLWLNPPVPANPDPMLFLQ